MIMLDEVVHTIAPMVLQLCVTYKAAPLKSAKRKYYRKVLKFAKRNLELFVTPHVSLEAQKEGEARGIMDLSRFQYDDQETRMNDKRRKIFHFEHMKPVGDIFQELVTTDPLNFDAVKIILMQTKVAWVTKSENGRLKRDQRIDPCAEYARARISLVSEPAIQEF
jgi:hypothetical protein